MSLKDYSNAELENELKRRALDKPKRPLPKSNINWQLIVNYLESTMKEIEFHQDMDQNLAAEFSDIIAQMVLDEVYGPEFWKWFAQYTE